MYIRRYHYPIKTLDVPPSIMTRMFYLQPSQSQEIYSDMHDIIKLFSKKLCSNQATPIGGGREGIVYVIDPLPQYAFKVVGLDFFHKQVDIFSSIDERLRTSGVSEPPLITINRAVGYKAHTPEYRKGILVLPRIYSLPGYSEMIVPLFGRKKVHKKGIWGMYLGQIELENLYNLNLTNYCYQLGQEMGILHYIAKVDGIDIELYLGHLYEQPSPPKVFIVDFGETNTILEYNKSTVETLGKVLTGIYSMRDVFPKSDSNELFQAFSSGYMEIAHSVAMGDIAQQVMHYVAKHPTNILDDF